MQDFVLPIHLSHKLLRGGDEDFAAVVVHLHEGVVGQFHEILAGADFSQSVIDHLKSDHFVEIEAVAGKLPAV